MWERLHIFAELFHRSVELGKTQRNISWLAIRKAKEPL